MSKAKTQIRKRPGAAVYDTLREMTLEYRFRPGEKINETEVSEALGVSRTPVREALNRLLTEGLIDFRRNYGFYCRKLDLAEVMSLAEAVRDVELALVDHVAARATPEALAALAEYSESIAEGIDSLPACDLARADEAFHARFADLAGNPVLADIARNLNARIRFLRKILMEAPGDRSANFRTQARIIRLLHDGQTEAARDALDAYLTLGAAEVKEALTIGLSRIYLDPINMDVTLSS